MAMDFCGQLRLLLWKMYIMKKRRPLGTLCEIFLPVLLTTLLLYVRDQVDIIEQDMTYGISVPVFSIFDVAGLPVSLPGTLDSQDICFGHEINKYIGVTPDDDDTRWFLSHLAEYYDYVSAQSLFDYYDWNYVSSNEDNFRDLLILVNNTFDLCAQHYHDSDDDSCDSFLDLLNTLLIFSNITNSTLPGNYSSDIISPNGQWTPQFIENILADLAEESDWNNEMLMLSQMLSTPQKPPCLNALTDIFMFFDTQQEMEQYTQYSDYGDGKPAIAAGIVFNHISNESIDYTLRFNMSDIQSTKKPYINDHYRRSPLNLMNQSFDKYVNSGFLGWQNAIDQTFLRILNYDTAINLKIGVHIFPFPPYQDDYFWSVVKRLLPMLLVIAFTYPFVIIAKTIVEEKSLRLKEGFRILGGSNTAYLLSYMITYLIIFTISNCFLVWCLCANIFIKTDPLVMFVGIELFGLCMIPLAMIVGMLFDQPRLGALVASLTFLVLFYIYRFIEEAPYESTKNAVCWSGPSAFALALLQFSEYEEYQIGAHWSNINELNELTHFRLSTAYIYMFLDFIIYTLLMFYLDRVWPTKYGVRRPFYAPFEIMDEWYDKIKWCREKRGRGAENMSKSLNNTDVMLQDEVNQTTTIEPVDEAVTGSPMLELSDLTKVFRGGNEGRDNIAVNRLNLKMYADQVFCLLGHNGAGKTTTCNMLTGMVSVTSGDAYIKDMTTGQTYSLVEQLPAIRSRTGLCPQHDILFPRMTVWEHLQFYGQVNGLSKGDELDELCMDLLGKIDLTDKLQFQSRMLSGGQRRKLSVCIALIGRTNLVILDEPTTGMDPFARRATWSLIREYKKNRLVILTTHFMDEAEILADRIGIMVHGKLMCCGSGFYLKQQYDVGYALTIQLSSTINMNQVLRSLNDVVQDHIKDGSSRIIGQAATEIVYRISFESNPYIPTLFRYIDKHRKELGVTKYAISATTLEEVFRTINEATVFSKEESVSTNDRARRDSASGSSYDKYGKYKAVEIGRDTSKVSVHSDTDQPVETAATPMETDLESVDEHNAELSKRSELESITVDGKTTTTGGGEDANAPDVARQASFLDGFEAMNRDATFQEYYQHNYVNIADRSKVPCLNGHFWSHVGLQMWKRALNAKRDAKTFWCQFMIPSFFIIWGLATNSYSWWENQPLYYFNTQDWIEDPTVAEGGVLNIPYTAYSDETRPSFYHSDAFLDLLEFDGNQSHDVYEPLMTTPYQSNMSFPEWQDVLYETRFDNAQPRYLSLLLSQVLDPNVIVVGANASAFHSIPTGLNLASSFIAQTISGNHSDPEFISNSYIKTASHPFPKTASQDAIVEAFNGFMTSIILAVGLIFVPAAYIALLVDERTNMVKHQQLVSGMDVISYWTGNFIFDVLSNLLPATLCVIYVACFDIDLFIGEATFATWLVIVMYGFAVVPFTYLAALFFSSPGTAQALTIFTYYTASVICMIAAWVMDIYPDPQLNETNKTMKVIYRFLPPFCLSDSFRGIATRDVGFLWGTERDVFDWDVTGRNLCIMFVESVGYFSLLLLMEYLSKSPAFLSWIGKVNMVDDAWRARHELSQDELDSDVLTAQGRLKGGGQTVTHGNDTSPEISPDSRTQMVEEDEKADIIQHDEDRSPIEIHGLRKVYPGSYSRPPTVAVQDLWYSVKKGEVFGFLGMNGAGKTTTLSIISGVFPATAGNAYVNGFPVTDQIAVRQSLGFCPQFSALFPRLTVMEHLEFFARIKGIHDKKVREKLSKQLIKDLNLERYTDRVAGKLSGGNQRKLSVGIALIGNPPIVLLDEPTSGMDPVSKRDLWDFISSTMSGRSVILTTHSMEECEVLCDRVGIMINGQLVCLGSNQHLKQKFAKGYQLDITKNKIFEVSDEKDNKEDIEMEQMNKNDIASTQKELTRIFGQSHVKIMENCTYYARFQVRADEMSIADVFGHLEAIKTDQFGSNILNYAVTQISLEQIFLGFAKDQKLQNKQKMENGLAASCGCYCVIGVCVCVVIVLLYVLYADI
eukprot:56003_1